MDNQQTPFYFDEFFGSDDEGIEVTLTLRGRVVPLRIKKGLTLREKAQAESIAIKRHLDPKTGRIVVDSVDEAAAAEELVARMILSWPFVTRDGSPVPVTRENVSKMLGGLAELMQLFEKMEQEGSEALAPFVSPSAAPSATPPVSDQ